MYRTLISAVSLFIALFGSAQSYVHQVLVLNEGYFNWSEQEQVVPVTLGSYDPVSGNYSTVATIPGSRFGSDVIVSGDHVYVAADSKLLKYDKNSFVLLDEAEVPGIRKIAVWNDKVLITRGELGGLPHYFEVRSNEDLSFVDAITPAQGLPHSIEDIEVADGKAWLAVNNSFEWDALTGYIAVVDLASMALTTIDLGAQGLNPEKLFVSDDAVYVLNNTDFSASSLSKIGRLTENLHFTDMLAVNSGCGASAYAEDQQHIYFMEYAVNTLARYDITSDSVLDTLQNSVSAYGMANDALNGVMYVTTTDHFSTGEFHVMDHDGTILSSVPVGVNPGHLALDIRSGTGIGANERIELTLYPNPANESVWLSGVQGTNAHFTITDGLGRMIRSQNSTNSAGTIHLDVSALEPGMYMVRLNGGEALRFTKH